MDDYKVVNAEQLDADLGVIADKIREQTGKTEQIPFPNGFASAPAELVEAGKKTAYDEYWDTLQDYGNRTDYRAAFGGIKTHSAHLFRPKYDIRPDNGRYVFAYSDGLDLTQDFGVAIDFSNVKEFIGTFMGGPQRIGVVNCSSATSINQIFSYGGVSYIEKLILNENCTTYNQPFANCTRLTDITIEGVLSATVSFQWCPLTAESAKSVINCLKNYAGTSEANTKKITFSATTWGYLDAEGENTDVGTNWREYIQTSKGWNI